MTDSKEPFGGFKLAIRTFWLKGTNLIVRRRWSRESLVNPHHTPKFSFSIFGEGILGKDSVCVIGARERIKQFSLTIGSDDNAKAEWEFIKSCDLDTEENNTPELRLKEIMRKQLDEAPPTATLFVTEADWELGTEGGWSIECEIPQALLTQLESELIAGQVQEVHIGIKWASGLVQDEHAPPSSPTTWGLFKTSEKHDPEPLRGYVTSFSWSISPRASSNI